MSDHGKTSSALDDLSARMEGEVLCDAVHRRLYSTDASIFQQLPLAVARPKHLQDCIDLVRFATEYGISLIPRGAGTSLAGQCVGEGLVVDLSRHMNRLLELDPRAQTVRVEPGVILDDLNDHLRPHGLMFGAETSTSSRCTIGGMIGNNAAGSHSILLGTTRDHVESLTAVLSDGSVVRLGPVRDGDLPAKCAEIGREGEIYRTLVPMIEAHRDLILMSYPSPQVRRRNTGYALDALAMGRPFVPEGGLFNLAPLICGSEGTLCLVTEATLRLVPIPRHNLLICAHFEDLDEALRGTLLVLEHQPAAVELLDGNILKAAAANLEQQRNRFWIQGEPSGVLAIELVGDQPDELRSRAEALIADFRGAGMGYAFPLIPPGDIERVWALRKAGVGLLSGRRGDLSSVTVTEDAAVAPADLPAYVAEMRALMERHHTSCVFYGHASVGLLHLRPMLNLRTDEGIHKLQSIAREAADIVCRFGGSLSGEHGDGLLRGPYLKQVLGPDVYQLLLEVKRAFDPTGIFNPNKIVDAPPFPGHLRLSPSSPDPSIDTIFDWSADRGLVRAAERCVGTGVCVRGPGRGTLCPSYQATREELHSTRGRANLFRQLLQDEIPARALTSEELHDALDLCLSCKACKAECPSSVDMARLKAEFFAHYHERHGTPLASLLFGHFDRLADLARIAPRFVSALVNSRIAKRLMGIDPRRRIPPFARQTFLDWFARRTPHPGAQVAGDLLLLVDPFTNHLEPEVAQAAVELLEAAGFSVVVPERCCSARSLISRGLIREAREMLTEAIERLYPHAEQGVPLVGLEPSELLTYRDEAPDLVVGATLRSMASLVKERTRLLEELVVERAGKGLLDRLAFRDISPKKILVHGHCHQKALVSTNPTIQALSLIPGAQVTEIPSGCCGMAGSFGYQHYELSMTIGEQVLFPAVRAASADTILVASGISCRQQIFDGTGRVALHPAQVLRDAVEG
ncbi:MAG: FAD-binding protein [Bradymonadales bacterium]|nr:FAD-binding protein [Bradymonadales bacterium]